MGRMGRGLKFLILMFSIPLLLWGCNFGGTQKPASVAVDGSSTVYPITKAVAEQFQKTQPKLLEELTVEFSGTTGGFRKFCEGKVDIANASRPINRAEMNLCNQNDVRYIELPVAFDALTVAVNKDNDWVDKLTVQELRTIWEPAAAGKIKKWNQVRPTFPDRPLNLFSPGEDSGTFDYFTEAIVGKVDASRTDVVFSEDDDILAQGIIQDPNALGYFGVAYFEKNRDKMKAVPIDNGNSPVAPTLDNVLLYKYRPLTRPLFIYVNAAKAQEKEVLKDFVGFYLKNAAKIVPQVGYIPLTDEHYHLAGVTFYKQEVGTVFGGKADFKLTLEELLRKQATFQ
ncbi:phosphate binding protein [Gloeomargarita lithophora Alchichica-D10]|uniref:Phosphate-binding protein n=2 Tax=Gloeomargarita TaxID=1188227 RepID=A0A1J0ABN4_9CYAN|nr:PstS family phosphate ABC transporter substrate-binding protein [Gloeomargarita lithophora]APB33339.1 phosphate binding protein [Gloeomargarita lithophora Alchichica-D10]